MSQPKFAIIILVWNQKQFTLNYLDSLKKITYERFEVVVVNNASSYDSAASLPRLLKPCFAAARLSPLLWAMRGLRL